MSKGFKQTEIGKIPSEWDVYHISDAFNIQQGKSLSARNQTGEFKKPFLRTSNVYWGRLNLSSIDEMDFSKEERDKLKFKYGDVLVCEGGEVGRTAIWRNELAECYYQNHIFRLRPRDGNTSPFYFVYWMQAGYLELKIYVGAGNKTTIPNLSRSRLSQFLFPLPPLPEQKKIATVLSKFQKAIEIQDNILGSLRDLKKSMMHRLFSYGLKGEKRKKTEIGLIPEGWEVKPLSDAVDYIDYGYSISIPEAADDGGIGIISTADMTKDGKLLYWKIRKIKAPEKTISRLVVKTGDVLFNWRNSPELIGKTCVYIRGDEPHIFASFILRIKCGNKSHNYFLAYLLNHFREKGDFVKLARRAVNQANYNRNEISVLPIIFPSVPEQQEITHILQTIDHKIEIHEGKKASYQDLFKTLLNKLMTGTIRVNELDIDTTEVDAA